MTFGPITQNGLQKNKTMVGVGEDALVQDDQM